MYKRLNMHNTCLSCTCSVSSCFLPPKACVMQFLPLFGVRHPSIPHIAPQRMGFRRHTYLHVPTYLPFLPLPGQEAQYHTLIPNQLFAKEKRMGKKARGYRRPIHVIQGKTMNRHFFRNIFLQFRTVSINNYYVLIKVIKICNRDVTLYAMPSIKDLLLRF